MVATAVEAVVVAVDSEVAPSAAEVAAVDSVVAAEAVAAVDLKEASEVAEEVVVEVVVLVVVVEVVEAVAVAATTVIKRATLLVNALRGVEMVVMTTTAIRQDNNSPSDSNDQNMKEKTKHANRLEVLSTKPTTCFVSYAVCLQLSLNVSNAL